MIVFGPVGADEGVVGADAAGGDDDGLRGQLELAGDIPAGGPAPLGGVVGVLLGVAGATVAAYQQELPPAFLWGAMAGAVGLATLIGLVFGLQPAWRAANVDPIQALRS